MDKKKIKKVAKIIASIGTLIFILVCVYGYGFYHGIMQTSLAYADDGDICNLIGGYSFIDKCFFNEGKYGYAIGNGIILTDEKFGFFKQSMSLVIFGSYSTEMNFGQLSSYFKDLSQNKTYEQHDLFKTEEQRKLGKMQSYVNE